MSTDSLLILGFAGNKGKKPKLDLCVFMALQNPFQAFTYFSTLYRYLSLVSRLYYTTKRLSTTAGVFVSEKQSGMTTQNYRVKETICIHSHYLICIVKNTQQLLWLGFCPKQTLRAVGSLRNTRKQVKSIFVSSLAGIHTEKNPQIWYYL